MGKLLWKPSEERIKEANITRFIEFVNKKHGFNIESYWQLYDWSVEKIPDFWATVWEFLKIKVSHEYEKVVDDLNKFPGARWFIGAKLNFAENLLRFKNSRPAIIARSEIGLRKVLTFAELYEQVACLANALLEAGVSRGDRVQLTCLIFLKPMLLCLLQQALVQYGHLVEVNLDHQLLWIGFPR